MTLRLLLDMNLSPEWVEILNSAGWPAVHWTSVGARDAEDAEILAWARAHGRTILTRDLDFGALLAATHASGPSVILVRSQRPLPEQAQHVITAVLEQYEADLVAGALVTLDQRRCRVRVLPL